MKNSIFILACIGVLACVGACGTSANSPIDGPIPCTDDVKPGPVVVTVDCVDDARSSSHELSGEPLIVEYQQNNDTWKPCAYIYFIDGDDRYLDTDYGAADAKVQLCGENKTIKASAWCGTKPGGTFYVRARQGNRSAGPIETTGEPMEGDAGKCGYYTDKSLSYELSLDVEE